ncbi:polysaccharide pyruvyl transferase family protein [Maribacter luteus]|uniref:polysaccharide pyruvyl transferase family protein n=1 Tax=Maribacter luteus TaxID=2594478 RepID=UPI002493A7BF|nr:polysaccharide pyruvyl transferase family protein [Maribacter luteus]
MKIGIYTIHADYNYGAMYQAYATQKALENLGYKAELVYLHSEKERKKFENRILTFQLKSLLKFLYARLNPKVGLKYKRFRAFHAKMNLSKRYYSIDEIYNSPPKYDIHLVGSDQVWNLQNGFYGRGYYFLNFLDDNAVKTSYAPSFGTSDIDSKYNDELKSYLSSFNTISVRETDGVNIIKKATGITATEVMDPTYLLDVDEWNDLISDDPILKGDYIFCYGFDGSAKSNEMLQAARKRLDMPLVMVSISLFFPLKVDKFVQEAGPVEFLNLVKNASFVCTSSYHGMAFAIQYKKSFFGTKHPTRNSRMNTMLGKLGLLDRQLDDPGKILEMGDDQLFIDYSKYESKITKAKTDSLNWLKASLQSLHKNDG